MSMKKFDTHTPIGTSRMAPKIKVYKGFFRMNKTFYERYSKGHEACRIHVAKMGNQTHIAFEFCTHGEKSIPLSRDNTNRRPLELVKNIIGRDDLEGETYDVVTHEVPFCGECPGITIKENE